MTELMHAPEAPSATLTRSRPHDDAPPAAERDPFTDAQRGMGNQGIQQLLQGFGVQAKLSVSEPGDELEEEADEVANQVLRMETPTPEALPLEEEDDEKKLGVKRRADSSSGSAAAPAVTPDVGAGISAARSGGLGLPSSERSFFEPRLGRDLSDVRVHTDAGRGALRTERQRARLHGRLGCGLRPGAVRPAHHPGTQAARARARPCGPAAARRRRGEKAGCGRAPGADSDGASATRTRSGHLDRSRARPSGRDHTHSRHARRGPGAAGARRVAAGSARRAGGGGDAPGSVHVRPSRNRRRLPRRARQGRWRGASSLRERRRRSHQCAEAQRVL